MNLLVSRVLPHMEVWSQDMVDLVEQGCFNFDEDDQGQFVFCAVEGNMNVVNTRMPELEFFWEGNDDTRPISTISTVKRRLVDIGF